jgi:hypothetical protein
MWRTRIEPKSKIARKRDRDGAESEWGSVQFLQRSPTAVKNCCGFGKLIKLGVACRYQSVSVTWARTRYALSAMKGSRKVREITISRSTANATSSSAASLYYTTNLEN